MDNLADEFLNEALSEKEEFEVITQIEAAGANASSSSSSNDEPMDTNYLNSETTDLIEKYKKRVDYTFTSSEDEDETPQPLRKQMQKASAEVEQRHVEEEKNEPAEIDIDKQMSYIESLKQKISQQQKQAFKQRDLISINDD